MTGTAAQYIDATARHPPRCIRVKQGEKMEF